MDTPDPKYTLEQRLAALAAYSAIFQADGFAFARPQRYPEYTDEILVLSEPAQKFVAMCYEFEWVRGGFSWAQWAATTEAAELRDNPARLAQATADNLVRLLTVCIRQERFVDGLLIVVYESGLLTNIVGRAAALLGESRGTTLK